MELTHDLRALVQGVPHMFIGGESKVRAGIERLASRRLGATSMIPLSIESAAFPHNGRIPSQYTSADGDNIQPALRFGDVPAGTKALVLLVEDPDAPRPQPFVHWVAWGIPGTTTSLPERVPDIPRPEQPMGMRQGRNGMDKTGWFGPRPPEGDPKPHRYHFQIFALDTDLDLSENADRQALAAAIQGHVVGQGELTGLYQAPPRQ